MPIYAFECGKHGRFDAWQSIHEDHSSARCTCGAKGTRVFTPLAFVGDLPSKDPRPGKTRAELFDNLAKEGLYNKEWRAQDEDTNRNWHDAGVKEKVKVGWTKSLEAK